MTSECQNHAPEFLTNSRKVVILLLNLLLFVMISITQTFAQPFLPSELSAKGISASVIGATYSAFGVTAMFSLLYLLFFFKNFGQQKLLFSIGGLVTAIATALIGQLDRAYEGKTFIAAFTIVRGCLGCGYIITWASAAPLLISLFPRDTGKVCSLITLGLNVGGIIGAPLGGFLYSVGGFAFPFWIVSSLHLLICSICYVGIPGGADGPQHENANHHQPSLKTVRDLLADPGVLSTCFAIMPVASVLGFIDVAFAAHLTQTYQIIKPGNFFLPFAITCAILSNLIGAFIDKGYTGIVFCFMGSMLGAITFLAMSQLKWILPRLTSLVTLEILLAFAALSVLCIINSSIPLLRKLFTRKNHNIPLVLLDAYAIIIFGISNCIGVVLGQCLVGGVILDKFGFYVSCLVISVSCAVTGLITGVILSKKKTLFRNPGHQPLISSSNSIIVEDSDSENLESDSNIVV